jgi:hypothetical protein
MSFKSIQKSKQLEAKDFQFILNQVRKDSSIVKVKSLSPDKDLIFVDQIILGEIQGDFLLFYSKYKNITPEIISWIEHLLLGKEKPVSLLSIKTPKVKKEKSDNYGEKSRVDGRSFEELFIENFKTKKLRLGFL